MKYLWSAWESVRDQINLKQLLLFLDFDGTLAPIVSRPEQARLPQQTRSLLKALTEKKSCFIAVVSGRSLSDIKQMIGLEELVYVGNHGLEIEGKDFHHEVSFDKTYLKTLQEVKADLQPLISNFKGAFIEDKGVAFSVHFRLVSLHGIIELHKRIREVLVPWIRKHMITVKSGKMVFEIRPPISWDKGKAALWLIDKWHVNFKGRPAICMYCGDDATDEDAFRVLNSRGITIVVGAHKDSAAHYYLNTQEEINDLLAKIAELKWKT